MMLHIYHTNCSKKSNNEEPEYKWGGFSMCNASDYICESCGDSIMILEESDLQVVERYETKNKSKQV